MPALNSWQLVVQTMMTAASAFQQAADEAIARLFQDGSSDVVNACRRTTMNLAMVAVGGFSMLEGVLEQTRGWQRPYQELEQNLREIGHDALAQTFNNYRLAINVLKHGYGESYERLLTRVDLPFRVKLPNERYFDEGDIGEIPGLILVDFAFVQSCAELIQDAFTALRIPQLDL